MANKENLISGLTTTGINSSATSISVSFDTDTDSGNATASSSSDALPDVPFFATLSPVGVVPNLLNSEIVSVTAKTWNSSTSCWDFTIARAQKSTTARAFAEGSVFTNGVYTDDIPEGFNPLIISFHGGTTTVTRAEFVAAWEAHRPIIIYTNYNFTSVAFIPTYPSTFPSGKQTFRFLTSAISREDLTNSTEIRVIEMTVPASDSDYLTISSVYGEKGFFLLPQPSRVSDTNDRLIYSAKYINSQIDSLASGAIGTTETLTIADTDWSALSSSDPYDYSATKTLTATIGANSTVELINDAAVDFATYGFAIGAVDTANNTVTFYSIGAPSASKTLKVNVKG